MGYCVTAKYRDTIAGCASSLATGAEAQREAVGRKKGRPRPSRRFLPFG
jgi:hypothetical protein